MLRRNLSRSASATNLIGGFTCGTKVYSGACVQNRIHQPVEKRIAELHESDMPLIFAENTNLRAQIVTQQAQIAALQSTLGLTTSSVSDPTIPNHWSVLS